MARIGGEGWQKTRTELKEGWGEGKWEEAEAEPTTGAAPKDFKEQECKRGF